MLNFRDVTAMGIHPTLINRDIPGPDFEEAFRNVCNALTDDLNRIDEQSNWKFNLEVKRNTTNE